MNVPTYFRLLGVAAATTIALTACTVYERPPSVTVTTTTVPSADSNDAVFAALDTNRDGFLSRGELDVLLGAVPASPGETPEMTFRRLDVDRDGFLSRHEVAGVISTIPGATFDQMDQNRDGFLSMAEAEPHLRSYSSRTPLLYSWFDTLDMNKDGFLTRAEATPLLNSARRTAGTWTVTPWPPVGVTVVAPASGAVYGPRY